MPTTTPVEPAGYDPAKLLDLLLQKYLLKNDAQLSRFLDLAPPRISKLRNRYHGISAGILLRIHETTGLSINDLRTAAGDRRKRFRVAESWPGTRITFSKKRFRRTEREELNQPR